jgi:hypothetical protein
MTELEEKVKNQMGYSKLTIGCKHCIYSKTHDWELTCTLNPICNFRVMDNHNCNFFIRDKSIDNASN